MNFAVEIEILKRRIEELSRNSGKFPPVTWGRIVGKLREQKDIAKNFRLKQDLLKSGENIKTINGQSLLGSGNLVITGVGDYNVDGGHSDSILLEQNINGGNA